MRIDTGQTVRLDDYEPTLYAAPSTTLMFALHPTRTIVRNATRYEPRGAGALGAPLELVGDGLVLYDAQVDGVRLRLSEFASTPEALVLKSPPRRAFTLTLTTVVSPDENTQLMGLYRSNGVYCTQCEAEGFRRITYAYDRPDVLTAYDVFIIADEALCAAPNPALLSNGNLRRAGVMDGRPSAHWHDPFPKPTYLFALVAGDLGVVRSTFTTRSGRKVDLGIYVEHGKEPRASYAMDALKRSMAWDETRFGLEYDLDVFNIVAVSDFNMGAMENKGLNVFNDRYVLADPAVATDVDYAGIETVIAHEYFHNWTGNRITCRDWFQLCLKEGLTVFRDQEFTSDERSRGVKRISDVRRLRLAQFPEDASPLRHPVRPHQYAEISNLYTATVYDKGAEVIRMIHTIIGERKFRAGMDRYLKAHDGTAATVEDFVAAFDLPDRAGFMRWYEEPGTPAVAVAEDFAGGRYSLSLTQRPAEGGSIKPIPVRLALVGATGKVDISRAKVSGAKLEGELLVLAETASIVVEGLNEAPVASLLRGFSAPVNLDRPADAARDLSLAERDDDPYTVWDATQRLTLAALAARYHGSEASEDALAHALTTVALAGRHEPAFRAYALTPPTRQTLVEYLGADVDAGRVDAAHKALAATLGQRMAEALATLHDAPTPPADDLSADAAGARALRNAALHFLTFVDDSRSRRQAETATTMTDRLAALSALTAAQSAHADAALDRFEADFEREPLVLDKWFALQATRPGGEALARVQRLMQHPKFSLKNPNRARSLIGAFAQNLAAFHAADGSGYRFLAEMSLTLDGPNPQVAARLLTAFGDVRRFDAPRRAAAAAVLADVLEKATSSDVKDIARRLTGG